MAEDRYAYEAAEEQRRRRSREKAEAGERIEIGRPGEAPRRYGLPSEEPSYSGDLVTARERAREAVDGSVEEQQRCGDSCLFMSGKDQLGVMSQQELENWQRTLVEQRDDARARKDISELNAFQREINCVDKWKEECEPKMSECTDDRGKAVSCDELRDEFQSGTTNVLPKQARDFLAEEAIQKAGDETIPRNEAVAGQKRLNCLGKYEDCLSGKK